MASLNAVKKPAGAVDVVESKVTLNSNPARAVPLDASAMKRSSKWKPIFRNTAAQDAAGRNSNMNESLHLFQVDFSDPGLQSPRWLAGNHTMKDTRHNRDSQDDVQAFEDPGRLAERKHNRDFGLWGGPPGLPCHSAG